MATIQPITLREAEFIAHRYAVEVMSFLDEPIPPFHTRYPGRLESCLAQPFQSGDGKYRYYRFLERAAVLFYFITKSQCFVNGNKRMAVTLTMVFFYKNKRWLDIPHEDLYAIACQVAESKPRQKDNMIQALARTFKTHEVPR